MDPVEENIEFGSRLIRELENYSQIDGAKRLERKIRQELHHLKKILQQGTLSKEKFNFGNLRSLGSVVEQLSHVRDVVSISKVFRIANSPKKITVDIVAEGGSLWIKVIAKSAKSLEAHLASDVKNITYQANEWMDYAKNNKFFFKTPAVMFVFRGGISEGLRDRLCRRGIQVDGHLVNTISYESDSDSELDEDIKFDHESNQIDLEKNTLNLDITAMIAYVSSLSNGHQNFAFKEPIIDLQAKAERANPVKPVLESVFANHRLICCRTAMDDFLAIVNLVGGPDEKERAQRFASERISEIVSDQVSERVASLSLTAQIKPRSKVIFGTGDYLKVPTVTANVGFMRSAENKGLKLAVILHESRALTEMMSLTADPILD